MLGLIFFVNVLVLSKEVSGVLYPRESESREIKDLSGKWKFLTDSSVTRNKSFEEMWWKMRLEDVGNVIDMPVPSSFNDITQQAEIRDFIGWAWYETTFYISKSWNDDNTLIWLHIGSAHYRAIVWLNSNKVMEHIGGHLPFECEVGNNLLYGQLNRLTIAVNNTLTPTTLPPGFIQHYSTQDGYPDNYFTQNYQFDFFNYAGIHRAVQLYTTPSVSMRNISTSITVDFELNTAYVKYHLSLTEVSNKKNTKYNVTVVLMDAEEKLVVAKCAGVNGTLTVLKPRLWWPVGMNSDVAYLYKMIVYTSILNSSQLFTPDIYRLPIGIRTVEVKGTNFYINNKPFYFFGVGKHEDWSVRGKGFDWASIVKDFNLLNWLGANSFRTSHYPYAEEIMQMCDEQGIVVIDECPAVGMHSADNFVNATLQHHKTVMRELVNRDCNHPSVVMWSVANEPVSQLEVTANYFKEVIEWTHTLDSTRPVTFVCNAKYDSDKATPFVDVVSVNKYEGWYNDAGHTEVIPGRLQNYLERWHQTRDKPIIHMEWGAGAIAGFHSNPPLMYTEEFLSEVMRQHFNVFDSLRNISMPFLVGEMVWNFADFQTAQATTRANGNKKGLFTRDRHPKSPANVIRQRYLALRTQTSQNIDKHFLVDNINKLTYPEDL